jgi:hypothetical protein
MVLALPSIAAEPDGIKWYAELYPQNTDYIEVTINTLGMKEGEYLENVRFDVTFYDAQNNPIKEEDFYFTDANVTSFERGNHRRWFKHSYTSAKFARGGTLNYTLAPYGGKPDAPTERRPGSTRSGERIQADPGDINAIGKAPGEKIIARNNYGDRLEIISFNPNLPARLSLGERLNIRIAYQLNSAESCRIFARPYTDNEECPGCFSHASPLYGRGSGELVGFFGSMRYANVDQVRVTMVTDKGKTLLIVTTEPYPRL